MIKEMMGNDELKVKSVYSGSDYFQLGLAKNILEEEKIHYIAKSPGSGEYMNVLFGASVYSTDLYVSEDDYLRAKELLESCFNAEPIYEDGVGHEFDDEDENGEKNEDFVGD